MTKKILTSFIAIVLMVLCTAPQAEAQQKKSEAVTKPVAKDTKAEAQQKKIEAVIADFEGKKSVARSKTSHKASVTLVDDVPEGSGKLAAKTVVEKAAGATGHFGTGFGIPALDLSGAKEIRFWIKTDIESKFNFQIHSDGNRTSVFRFTTDGSKAGKWTQIKVPLAKLSQPPWAKEGKADLTKVIKFQVTAFQSGPYDGKCIILDNVVHDGKRAKPASAKKE